MIADDMLKRWPGNPIVTPADVRPSRPDWRVDGAFNAAVARVGADVVMLVRVAESAADAPHGEVRAPLLESDGQGWRCTTRSFQTDDPAYDFSDPRVVRSRLDPRRVHLTSMSHLRVARSGNGTDFVVEDRPFLFPAHRTELFGCEDARITPIDGRYYINYTAVSEWGIATALAVTDDFVNVERLGILHAPDNRDVCLFPRRGWLQIYHGVSADQRYSLGALLLDLEDPRIVRARLARPLGTPADLYEVHGFFGNVLFTCGALIEGRRAAGLSRRRRPGHGTGHGGASQFVGSDGRLGKRAGQPSPRLCL